MIQKVFLDSEALLLDSFRLGAMILNSGFIPTYMIAVWRGGTPVGVAVQEILQFHGVNTDHIAIRTSSYSGIDEQSDRIAVHGLNYLVKNNRKINLFQFLSESLKNSPGRPRRSP